MIRTHIQNGILTITMDASHNKLSLALTQKLSHALLEGDADDDISVIILLGSEKAFSVGAALDEIIELKREDIDGFLSPWETLSRIQKPVIIGMDGYVLGGGLEIAMMGDILVATEGALFGQPEINLALLPGCGGTWRLLHAIGYHRAIEMCLRGEFISAAKAYEFGLVNHVVPKDQLREKVHTLGATLAKKSPRALMEIKKLMRTSFDMNAYAHEMLRREREVFKDLLLAKDGQESVRQFVEKGKG